MRTQICKADWPASGALIHWLAYRISNALVTGCYRCASSIRCDVHQLNRTKTSLLPCRSDFEVWFHASSVTRFSFSISNLTVSTWMHSSCFYVKTNQFHSIKQMFFNLFYCIMNFLFAMQTAFERRTTFSQRNQKWSRNDHAIFFLLLLCIVLSCAAQFTQ